MKYNVHNTSETDVPSYRGQKRLTTLSSNSKSSHFLSLIKYKYISYSDWLSESDAFLPSQNNGAYCKHIII